jgi:arylsulfatase A-like enzyme
MRAGLILAGLACLLAAGQASAEPRDARRTPNILLILADDLGYGHLGSYGQKKIRTPNLDRLAAQGMRFTSFYAGSSVCAPSRSSLMEGLDTGSTTIRGNTVMGIVDPSGIEAGRSRFAQLYKQDAGQHPLPADAVTLAEMLRARGYRTGMAGKWDLGAFGTSGAPNAQGFDWFYGLTDQRRAHTHYPSEVWRDGRREKTENPYALPHRAFRGDPSDLDSPEYDAAPGTQWFGDLLAEEAAGFIERHRATPFFLYLSLTAPHAALQAPPEAVAEYAGRFPETPYVNYSDNNGYVSRRNPRALQAAMITRMDVNIGRVLDALDVLGLTRETVVLFTSDNGPSGAGGQDIDFFDSNGPLRGAKRDLYEGGIRVPLIVRWPGVVAEGAVSEHAAAAWDIMPTLAEIGGRPYLGRTDGISFLPTLTGDAPQPGHESLYWVFYDHGGSEAVRLGRWKGIRLGAKSDPGAPIALFDLENDIGESRNLAPGHPEIVARIEQVMQRRNRPSWNPSWSFGRAPD